MGTLLSRYWHPVLRSTELVAGGAPERVRLLGENYVAFRAGDGRVGFFDEGCPHRRASLVLARNGDCALTCLFHGWKIDVSGAVVDAPSEGAARKTFAPKVKVRHFPAREAGGLIWAFVGAGEPTQFPRSSSSRYPPSTSPFSRYPSIATGSKAPKDCSIPQHAGHPARKHPRHRCTCATRRRCRPDQEILHGRLSHPATRSRARLTVCRPRPFATSAMGSGSCASRSS